MFNFFTTSRDKGRPIELYQFVFGSRSTDVYRYTDAEFPVEANGYTWNPLTIDRQTVTNNGTLDKSTLEVAMPIGGAVPELFRIYPPGQVVTLTILQGEAEDPDQQYLALWSGRVTSCSYEMTTAKLNCEPISTAVGRVGLRRNFQYQCPHVLYGPQCRASKDAATVLVEAQVINGREILLDQLLTDPQRWAGGLIEYTNTAGLFQARTVIRVSEESGSTKFLLASPPTGLVVNVTLKAIRGCRRTELACSTDHDNAVNFGGQPYIPTKNPIGANNYYL